MNLQVKKLLVVVFFKKDFIYLFDRDRDSQREREHKRGVGEEEAGS